MEPGADATKDAPALGAQRRFRERGTLYFQYEVYGAKTDPSTGEPAVASGWTIRDRSGTEWAGVSRRGTPAAGVLPFDSGMAGDALLAPGQATLTLAFAWARRSR